MARTDRTRRIADSVAARAGVPGLARILAGLPASALGSLLLAAFRDRGAAVGAAGLRDAAGEALFRPAGGEARLFHRRRARR
jgi:hypothetical protein